MDFTDNRTILKKPRPRIAAGAFAAAHAAPSLR
jgi:hypothetical protein